MIDGNRLVRLIYPVHRDCHRLIPGNRDRKIMRRHFLKLRYWPEKHPESHSGLVLDLDWSLIAACKGLNIGELRVNHEISGFNNWRVIFFEGPKPPEGGNELHKLWILQVMKKKRDEFTDGDIKTFKLRRTMVVERYYNGWG